MVELAPTVFQTKTEVLMEYEFYFESDYGYQSGIIEADNVQEFYKILKEDYKQDIGADGFYNCPISGNEKGIRW